MKKKNGILPLLLAPLFVAPAAHAAVELIAVGTVDGNYQDFATETAAPLENGVPGNILGGVGSGLAYAGGNTFIAVPDRGPNANAYNSAVDDTVSYINRFQTFSLSLAPSAPGAALPFTMTPMLMDTTLLSSRTPLVYGDGVAAGLGDGAPALNDHHTYYFMGRSDNFDPSRLSNNPDNARLDPEGVRVSNDGRTVFISDEYGPYLYQFDRASGQRIRSYKLPDELAVATLSSQGDVEKSANDVGRTANKGMEGLAITPDGKTLVGMIQANLRQDKKKSLRIVTVDVHTGLTHQYAYKLTDGSGVSEIIAVNDHQFLVDERDGSGMADTPETPSAAEVKKLFLIDLDGAQDVSGMSGDLSDYAVAKTEFLDIVAGLNAGGIDSLHIPSKIEGLAFGPDVVMNGTTKHTLYISNDNDFLGTIADPSDPANKTAANPNQFYVFAFDGSDLPGYVPQRMRSFEAGCWFEKHHRHH